MFNHEFVAVKSAIQKTTPPTIRRGLLTLRDRGLNTIIRYRLRNKWEGSWPDFIIVGTQKGGTTYIYDELCRHPAILPAISKEIHYFDHNFYRGTDWYQAFFERSQHIGNGYNKKFITGEASPSYIFHPHAARRIQELKPDTRLIVMLRNPVNRAYSHYQHEVRLGYETLSFEEAIEREQERLSGERERMLADEDYESVNYMHYSYLARGVYINQLQTLRNYFPEEQILIIKSEEFFKDTQAVMRQVFAFLGLPDWKSDDQKKPKHFPYSPMNPKTRWYLIDFFKPYNEELFKYSGVNYGWNQ